MMIGVDLGGTRIKAGIVEQGAVTRSQSVDTGADKGPGHVLDVIAEAVKKLEAQPQSIGLAIPGGVNPEGKVWRLPNVPGFEGVNISAELSKRLGCRVVVENDATTAALAELHLGHGRAHQSFVMITLGTGIGGGVVIDGIRLLTFENIGFNKSISIGNKLNLNECDYLSYFMSDPETQMIGMYLENFTDGRRLMALAQQTDKPIVILKANKSASSHQIAQFHTTALAGDDEATDAALKQAGIHRAQTLQEMIDDFKIFSLPLIQGRKIGVICRSGGQAVMLTDAVHQHGFELAKFSDQVFDYVKKEVRAGVIRMTNPLDLGDVFDIRFYIRIIEKVLQEPDVDGVVFGHTYLHGVSIPPTQELIRSAKKLSDRYQKPVVFLMIAGKKYFFTLKETADFPIFADPEQVLKSLSLSREHLTNRSAFNKDPLLSSLPMATGRKVESTPKQGIMNPDEVFHLLKSYGLPVADFAMTGNITEALNAAKRIGYPVALKMASPGILHKTEAKGVILDIPHPQALADACRNMRADAYLIQKMAAPGQEVIIGGRRDQEFGPVILFGLGGLFTEVLRDVALRICPIHAAQALAMIEETKGARILKGFRGNAAADMKALADCLVKVSKLLVKNPDIGNLDMNPLFIFEKNKGCLVVDAKIERI